MFTVGMSVKNGAGNKGVVTNIDNGLFYPVLVKWTSGCAVGGMETFTLEGRCMATTDDPINDLVAEESEAAQTAFKVGDRVMQADGQRIGRVVGIDLEMDYPVDVEWDDGHTDVYTLEGRFAQTGCDSHLNITPFDFKVGDRVRRVDGLQMGHVETVVDRVDYPIVVLWDEGGRDEYTADGKFYVSGNNDEWNIVLDKVETVGFKVGDQVTEADSSRIGVVYEIDMVNGRYPVLVRWDDGAKDEYTRSGQYYADNSRPTWNITLLRSGSEGAAEQEEGYGFVHAPEEPELELTVLDPSEMERAKEAAQALFYAFCWRDTEEGHDYWNEIHRRLLQLGRTGR